RRKRAMGPSLAVTLSCCCCLAILICQVSARSDGAPESTCQDLFPQHGQEPQQSDPPYQIFTSPGVRKIRLFVGSDRGTAYQGFIIHARDVNTGELVGEFINLPQNDVRHLECTPGRKNAVTHIEPKNKLNLEFDWEFPEDYDGTIVFNSTICKTWDVFWVGVESSRISVSKRSIEIHSTPSPITYRPTTPPYYTPTTEQTENKKEEFYAGCGSTKNCFGIPDNCVDQRNCMAAAAILVAGERYIFELQTTNTDAKYVAIGLSDDDKMGDDSVVECVNNNEQISLHMSWNDGKKNFREPTLDEAVRLTNGSVRDGTIYCRFERKKVTQVRGKTFDLVAKPYNLLIAVGSVAEKNRVGYHDLGRSSSSEPKLLADVGRLASASDLLTRLHGALMLVSWLGTASVGMLLARYYRQTWVNSQFCGKDQWFAWHRMFMFLTWVMTIAAFILIMVELGEWSSATNHASFGLATIILCFIQPFMAAMRPHPGSSKRALFNWIHWLVGNAAHICAIVAIFFAVRLSKAKLPEWVDWIIVAYVAFHVLTHVFLTFAGCASDRQGSHRVNSFPMKDVHTRNSMTHQDVKKDAPHSGLRKLVFSLYFLVVAALVTSLVLIVVFAPINESWDNFANKML
ncbi:hypothetical protein QAD02_004692, partial [Eretmocerus hayati]